MARSNYWVGTSSPRCKRCGREIQKGEKFDVMVECELTDVCVEGSNVYEEEVSHFGVETGDGWDPICKVCTQSKHELDRAVGA